MIVQSTNNLLKRLLKINLFDNKCNQRDFLFFASVASSTMSLQVHAIQLNQPYVISVKELMFVKQFAIIIGFSFNAENHNRLPYRSGLLTFHFYEISRFAHE